LDKLYPLNLRDGLQSSGLSQEHRLSPAPVLPYLRQGDAMRRLCVLALFCMFFVSVLALAKEVTIHGFVTEIKSTTSFNIDDYSVTRDNSLAIEVVPMEDAKGLGAFTPEDMRVGTELEVKGEYDETTRTLKAKTIKAFLEDNRRIRRTAVLEQLPSLTIKDSGWEGEIHADGQIISVLPSTSVTIKPNKQERKSQPDTEDAKASKLTSIEGLNLDTFVRYEGTRQPSGKIVAQKIEFRHGELENGEAKMWKHYEPKVKDPDYSAFIPGQLKMHWKKYRIVPEREAQKYIETLGESLVPAHQKDLPADSPLKIPFRFYLVQSKHFNASAYPNGVVVVHSAVFDVLQNEAQLAFVLAHEISHSVEKHTWQELHYHRTELIALRAGGAFIPFGGGLATSLAASGIQNQYIRSLEDQADRVGLEWMLAAGYDIREAPASWKALSLQKGDRPMNPFWDTHDNLTTRRSYLMAELKNNYSEVDYSKLKKDSEQFHKVAEMVKKFEADNKKADKKKDD
jgi:hypothetical protein